ncbi:patatin family protein, partial [Reticulomyxa filosa]
MAMSLKRNLESYRSWIETEDKKSVKTTRHNTIEMQSHDSNGGDSRPGTVTAVAVAVVSATNLDEEQAGKQDVARSQEQRQRDKEHTLMFVKEEVLYRLFPFMETMMTLFSAWAFRDTINVTLVALGAKPGTAVGISILWAYAISLLAVGLFYFYFYFFFLKKSWSITGGGRPSLFVYVHSQPLLSFSIGEYVIMRGCLKKKGMMFAVAMGHRMQAYSKEIRILRRKGIRFEYLYRVQRHQKEYMKVWLDEWDEHVAKGHIKTSDAYDNDDENNVENDIEEDDIANAKSDDKKNSGNIPNAESRGTLPEHGDHEIEMNSPKRESVIINKNDNDHDNNNNNNNNNNNDNDNNNDNQPKSIQSLPETEMDINLSPNMKMTTNANDKDGDEIPRPNSQSPKNEKPAKNGHAAIFSTPTVETKQPGHKSRPSLSEGPSPREMSRAMSVGNVKRRGAGHGPRQSVSVSVNEWYDHFRYQSLPNFVSALPELFNNNELLRQSLETQNRESFENKNDKEDNAN